MIKKDEYEENKMHPEPEVRYYRLDEAELCWNTGVSGWCLDDWQTEQKMFVNLSINSMTEAKELLEFHRRAYRQGWCDHEDCMREGIAFKHNLLGDLTGSKPGMELPQEQPRRR
jgi:hypothetical protein